MKKYISMLLAVLFPGLSSKADKLLKGDHDIAMLLSDNEGIPTKGITSIE